MQIRIVQEQMEKLMKKKRNTETDRNPERRPVRRCQAEAETGLAQEQVQEYIEAGWTNAAVASPSKTVSEIIKGNLFTYFNLVFAVLAVLVILAGSFRSLTFLPVVLANLVIGIVQEIRAKRILDKLSMLNAPKAVVIRDGERQEIPAGELVLDDIVFFQAGNQICADAAVLEGEVSVNESLLTGESDEVPKRAGDLLMSGSFVASGSCYARLEKVGEDSYISGLTLEAKAAKTGEQSEMLRILDRLVGVMGILIIPIGIALFAQQYFFLEVPFGESIVSMVAAVVGMIPEGLYLLASVALVVSVMRLASKKVLVHDMKCIETLARVDVLCVDKTGTITENAMEVSGVVPMGRISPGAVSAGEEPMGTVSAERASMGMSPAGEALTEKVPAGELSAAASPTEGASMGFACAGKNGGTAMPGMRRLLSDFVAAMPDENATMKALKRYFNMPPVRKAEAVVPFSSACKYSGAVFGGETYVLGAPEFVLREDYETFREQVEGYGSDGCRVLVFGRYEGVADGKELTGKVAPLCLILLLNPIRRQAYETFRYFSGQGVEIKVISGDNPVTASRAALQAGIAGAEDYVDASALATPEELRQAAEKYTVFGRVTPEQKRELVRTLKDAGHTVAMAGDGVNDVLALKDADCSVAMAAGSDAAAQVSQLVLLESDFSCMPSVVLEGRRVVNNIGRSASLFLVKNLFSFLLALFSLCFRVSYPLEPAQVSLISMFTIGIPAFFLALQPNQDRIRGHFLANVLIKALPAGLTDFLVVGALVVFGQVFEVDSEDISTACTMLLAIVGFMILYNISKPMDGRRWCIWGGCVTGLLVCSIWLGNLFGIGGMSPRCIMLFVVFAIVTEPILRYGTRLVEWLGGILIGWGGSRQRKGKRQI